MISTLKTDKPPLAQPEPDPDFDDIVFESFNQRHESGGLFLEDDDSKTETIKRCPPGWVFMFVDKNPDPGFKMWSESADDGETHTQIQD